MNKIIIGIALILICIIGLLIFFTTGISDKTDQIQSLFVLLLVVGFGGWTIFRRFISSKRGEPAEDEFSKLILQKAASLSYYASLYLWLIISYFSSRLKLESEQLIGYGIIGMAILFVGIWSFLKVKGLRND